MGTGLRSQSLRGPRPSYGKLQESWGRPTEGRLRRALSLRQGRKRSRSSDGGPERLDTPGQERLPGSLGDTEQLIQAEQEGSQRWLRQYQQVWLRAVSPLAAGGMAVDVAEYHLSVIKSPPDWEVGVYAAGALALLGIAAVSLWKLWTSGSFPSPSPFPNYDYRYLQQKYGETYAEARQKRVPAWNAQRASTRGPPSRKGSLSIEDTFESISELGPLELMGRELDLAPYGTLRKSQSADSLNSVSSVSNNFGQDFTLGQVEVSMDYDAASHTLHVAVLQGKDLLEREEASFESCFMRVSLLPDEQIVGISRIQRNAYSIFFDEKFSIPLDPAALEEKSLRFSVFGIDEDERNVSTGVVELKLSVLDLPLQPFSGWLYLQDQNKAADAVGEILLSLSYLPTAERLTVVVVKAKNLIWTNDKTTADPFVKVYLLQDGRKMSKKKTAVKRDDPNPVFNEAMIFSVPAIVLQDLSLRVTVAESSSDGRGDNVGHVIIGPSASGMGTTHWNQMLATLRRPVSMWHPVRQN
ncbi:hypothetical protein MJT46_016675 [Ovis ammon polii x Ovis aries]|nr:hypothetical protein MJT46_016675 [Ovis ammon polii x Ovis aries]